MSEKSQIVFMQARLIRLAAKKWHTDIQKANALMNPQSYGGMGRFILRSCIVKNGGGNPGKRVTVHGCP